MKITVRQCKFGYLVVAEDGRDRFIQFEADIVGLATAFGRPKYRNSGEPTAIPFATDFLDECEGQWIDDPGYFE